MAVNKVDINGEIVLDLTGDTVTPEALNQGVTAHNAAGEQIVGTQVPVATVNLIGPDDSGNVALTGGDIPMSQDDSTTLSAKIAAKQSPTQNLDAETALADEDSFPFYDASASANKRTLWSSIVAKLKGLFLPLTGGTLSGSVTVEKDGYNFKASGQTGDVGFYAINGAAGNSIMLNAYTSGSSGLYLGHKGTWLIVHDGTNVKINNSVYHPITAGTAAPSGGSDGDIYLKYT